jgi:copper chaperone NosL
MKKSKILMIVGSLLLLGLFFLPLWNITLEAPQYPIPLGMDIYINKFADYHEHDIKNINLMNHYVGMKYIPETIPEFKIFPLVIGIMSVLGVILGFLGKHKLFLAWFILMSVLCIAGMYDFYLWEYDYGHNLDPKAIMSFKNPDGTPMGFQPPLFGTKDILNFTAHSYPRPGGYVLFIGLLLTLAAFFVGRAEVGRTIK